MYSQIIICHIIQPRNIFILPTQMIAIFISWIKMINTRNNKTSYKIIKHQNDEYTKSVIIQTMIARFICSISYCVFHTV